MSQPINNTPPTPDKQAKRMMARLRELNDQHLAEISYVAADITTASKHHHYTTKD